MACASSVRPWFSVATVLTMGGSQASSRDDGWDPPIVKTVATENQGLEALAAAIDKFRQTQLSVTASSERRRAIARWRIVELLRERLLAQVLASNSSVAMLEQLADEVATRRRDPYSAVEEIIQAAES